MPVAKPPVAELGAHLGYWMRAVSNHVSHAFARKLAGSGVTVAEWAAMRMLYGQPPMPPSQLAARMGMTRGAITRLADRLIAKGLLARRAEPEDGRAQTLSLTARGSGLVPVLADFADQNEEECFRHLSPADRCALDRILKATATTLRLTAVPID